MRRRCCPAYIIPDFRNFFNKITNCVAFRKHNEFFHLEINNNDYQYFDIIQRFNFLNIFQNQSIFYKISSKNLFFCFSGSSKRIHPFDSSTGSSAAQSEESARKPASSAKRDGFQSCVAGDDERNASVMLGPPSEASRPRCPHGVDLTLGSWLQTC